MIAIKIPRVLQKFCVVPAFSTCGNTVAPKLRAHVTEDIPSAHVKFHSKRLKNNDGSNTDSCARGCATKCY